jgi:hypothetical protein
MRRLTVFAQDPHVRAGRRIFTARVDVPSEYLRPGPAGHRVHVIDYDASTDRLIAPSAASKDDEFEGKDPASR